MLEHIIPPCPECGGAFVIYLGHTPTNEISLRCHHCQHGWVVRK